MKRTYWIPMLLLLSIACSQGQTSKTTAQNLQGLSQLTDCTAVRTYLDGALSYDWYADGIADGASGGDTGGDAVTLPGSIDKSLAADANDAQGEVAPAAADELAPQNTVVVQGDIVKQLGQLLYVLSARQGLFVYDLSSPLQPKRIAAYPLNHENPRELYVVGSQIVVISEKQAIQADKGEAVVASNWQPSEPELIVRWLELRGETLQLMQSKAWPHLYYSDSRQIGDDLYLVAGELLHAGSQDDFIARAGNCEQIYALENAPKGYGSVSVWHVLAVPMQASEATAVDLIVFGGWDSQINASPEHFFLTTERAGQGKLQTDIYVLSVMGSEKKLTPVAHNQVIGTLINQFSLDEYEGHLRVATRTGLENFVSVFKISDDALELVGKSEALAPGEDLTASTFQGPIVYLTTAVQMTDPLFILDLSQPTQPQLLSELELPYVPAYLHLWEEEQRLITVGSTQGGLWGSGEVVLNLFDVSDLKAPKLLQQYIIPESNGGSEALSDHRAFNFIKDEHLLLLPVNSYDHETFQQSSKLAAVRVVPGSGFSFVAALSHQALKGGNAWDYTMRRGVDYEDVIYAISEGGVTTQLLSAPSELLSEDWF